MPAHAGSFNQRNANRQMIPQHSPLTHLSEADLIWIDRFADALRERDPHYAMPERGTFAVDTARRAFESQRFRSLSPPEAVAAWLEQ